MAVSNILEEEQGSLDWKEKPENIEARKRIRRFAK